MTLLTLLTRNNVHFAWKYFKEIKMQCVVKVCLKCSESFKCFKVRVMILIDRDMLNTCTQFS